MRNITIFSVGKIKEKFYREAVAEYEKRLGRYCRLKIVEVADEKTPQEVSQAERDKILDAEGSRLLSRIPPDLYLVALDIRGKETSSEGFAGKLEQCGLSGVSDIGFVIGGSLGLSAGLQKRANASLSFSRMTFPHQLMRVILLEQIYRAFRIIHKEPYHK